MPTNISTPIWACDVCGATFGGDRERAALCESAPLPELLPAGTPLLAGSSGHYALIPIHPIEKVGTNLTPGSTTAGHHRCYSTGTWTVKDSELYPAKPGFLQVTTGRYSWRIEGPGQGDHLDAGDLFRLTGLGRPGSPVATGAQASLATEHHGSARVVRLITPAVRAIFDALGAGIETNRWNHHQRSVDRRDFALWQAGGNGPKAMAVLATTDPAELDAEIFDLQRRWFAGEQIAAPRPHLAASSTMTPSKLTKAMKALVEEVGVPWEPRTNASEYARTVARRALMDTISSSNRLFGGPAIVAVGGAKGGVGKSTVAAALARALADSGTKVTLVDLDLDGPSQHLLHDLGPVRASKDGTRLLPTQAAPGLRVFSSGQIPEGLPTRWSAAASTDWIRFAGSTLDVSGDDILILDLPAGFGPVADQVIGYSVPAKADVLVAVTTADPLALADTRRALERQMHETHQQIVVENLSQVSGTGPDGEPVTIRLHGRDGQVEALASEHDAVFAGSMPWVAGHAELAGTQPMRALAAQVTTALQAT